MSGERRGTQPPQEERPAAPRIAEEGENSRDKDRGTGGNEKDNHRCPSKQILQFLLKNQKTCNLLFSLKFFSTMR